MVRRVVLVGEEEAVTAVATVEAEITAMDGKILFCFLFQDKRLFHFVFVSCLGFHSMLLMCKSLNPCFGKVVIFIFETVLSVKTKTLRGKRCASL